ncbi:hypothetical protein Airi01_088530 [Actinoallomurus iriomotensis]|uniref:Uncharacterized protein n=2 Tax=Actinoallomurus iriomotensis TaxID=478107 RepID=A0A9W6VWB0_9ACTN|nr:hypothetical protein Airi01_088530 [Actinoallomurus iriomotensis]
MTPEDAVDYHQQLIARFRLADDVAESTRNKFGQLGIAYAHGVLCYELFTLVEDAAQLTLEQALRDRFAAQYHGQAIEVRDRRKHEHQIAMTSFNDFFYSFREIRGAEIRLAASREWVTFNGTLAGLLTWARREGLLGGQRNRSLDRVWRDLRNMVAHGAYHLVSPVEAARSLSDLSEVINRLWGHPTPGGRLYPAPLSRSIVAIGWSDSGDKITLGYADDLVEISDEENFTYVLVRAVFCPGGATDPNLLNFDARSATTTFPTQYIWGPGSRDEAVVWLDGHHPQPDECDYLDQVVLVRIHGGQVGLPMYPRIAAGLPPKEHRDSTWYVLRVDRGLDALAHLRAVVGTAAEHAAEGECRACPVETLARGDFTAALKAASNAGADTTPLRVPDVRTPFTRFIPLPAPLQR